MYSLDNNYDPVAEAMAVNTPIPEPSNNELINGGLAGKAHDGVGLAETIGNSTTRFNVFLTSIEVERQLEKKAKFLQQLKFESFNPRNEEAFEDWVDEAAKEATRLQVSCEIFQEAWIAAARPAIAGLIRPIPRRADYESLVNAVCAKIFPNEGVYLLKLKTQILGGSRRTAVLDARVWLEDKIARYVRLCRRRNHPVAFADRELIEVATRSLPVVLSQDIRRQARRYTWDELWHRASEQEQQMIDEFGKVPEDHGAYAAEDLAMEGASKRPRTIDASTVRRTPADSVCNACGERGHWRRVCEFKDHRCKNCQRIGHISKACKNMVVKDGKGRVDVRVEPKPGSTSYTQRKDLTQKEKMISTEAVLEAMRRIAERRAQKSSESRTRRKQEEGWVRKRKDVPHPVAAARDSDSGNEDQDPPDNGEEPMDWVQELRNIFEALPAYECGSAEMSATVKVAAKINGQESRVTIDSGASKSLCSLGAAKRLGLILSCEKRRFEGVGSQDGTKCMPVTVEFPRRQINISFYAMDQASLPILIGASELREMNVLIDPKNNMLLDADTYETVAYPAAVTDAKNLDTVTQRPKETTDEQLRETGREEICQLTNHLLDRDLATATREIFYQHEAVWLRPRPGGAQGAEASFIVQGPPIREKLRHLTNELQAELDKQLDSLLESQVIRPSKSAWASVPVFVPKKDGGWRMCLDYRRLNKQMEPDAYPLPLLWHQVQAAAQHQWYVKLDLNWGFWGLPLAEESRQYTAFITHRGSFEFTVLPFGIRNSPSEFQRVMDDILAPMYHKGVLCYIDDVIIYADTPFACLELLNDVLTLLETAGLCIKLSKTAIMQERVKFLGHVIGFDGISPDSDKIAAVKASNPPVDKKQLRSFLGMASYLRKFVPQFATLVAPLTALLKKRVEFKWTPECEEAFEALKEELSAQVLLSAPRGNGSFAIATDASDYGVGAVLMQDQFGELVILEFASRSLSPTEKRWATYEREAYAIRWAVEKFEPYIKTGRTLLATDHQALQWLHTATSGKVRRWALYIQQFALDIVHVPGEANNIADWLSRSVPDMSDEFNDEENIGIPALAATAMTAKEEKLRVGQEHNGVPYVPTPEDLRRGYMTMPKEEEKDTYESDDGLRYSIRTNRLYIPPKCRELFLYWFHTSRFGGHCGVNRTVRRLNRWVWWPKIAQDTQSYIKNCLVCIRHGAPPKPITTMNILSRPLPLQLISLDIVGPRKWNAKNWYYLVIMDHGTRYMVARATTTPPNATWVIKKMKNHWVPLFQSPAAVLTDRGAQFQSAEFSEFVLDTLQSQLVFTSPYYPQGNAVNEAAHKALDSSLSASYTRSDVKEFPEELNDAVIVHNAVPHAATGHSPNYLLFGFELTLPGWQKYRQSGDDNAARISILKLERLKALGRAQVTSEFLLQEAKETIAKGDWVVYWLSSYERRTKESDEAAKKYTAHWSLPAKVKKVQDKICIVIPWGSPSEERQVPIAQVRRLEGALPPTLVEANMRLIERIEPRSTKHWLLRRPDMPRHKRWAEVLEDVEVEEDLPESSKASGTPKKRKRTTKTSRKASIHMRQEDIDREKPLLPTMNIDQVQDEECVIELC